MKVLKVLGILLDAADMQKMGVKKTCEGTRLLQLLHFANCSTRARVVISTRLDVCLG